MERLNMMRSETTALGLVAVIAIISIVIGYDAGIAHQSAKVANVTPASSSSAADIPFPLYNFPAPWLLVPMATDIHAYR